MKLNKFTMQVALAIITLLVLSPTFFNGFQQGWDDHWQVLNNPFITNISAEKLTYHFTNYYHGQYSPVNTLTYIVAYQLTGFNPAVFHAMGWLIHLMNVLLLFLLAIKITGALKPKWEPRRLLVFSFYVALTFAIHPLQVESVAWISASKVLLYTFFFLVGIWYYIRYIETGAFWRLLPVAACYLLAYGSKEQAIIFPLNLLLIDYALGRFTSASISRRWLFSTVVIEKIPFFVIAGFLYWFSVENGIGGISGGSYPPGQRLMFSMSSIIDYIFRTLAPVKLYYFYFFPIGAGQILPSFYWVYPLLVIICGWAGWQYFKQKNKIVVFGILLFLVNLALSLHILPLPRTFITADRFIYLSMAGAGFVIVWALFYFMARYRAYKSIIAGLAVVWFLFLGTHSFLRTMQWKDSETVKSNVAKLVEERKAKDLHFINPFDAENE